MKCQSCQNKEATIHYTKVINDSKTELHLCGECAKQSTEFQLLYDEEKFSVQNFLSGLLNISAPSQLNSKQNIYLEQIECPNCKLTFEKFKRSGKVGCSNCYSVFASQIAPVIRKLQSGNEEHVGKIPTRSGEKIQRKKKIDHLKAELQELIKVENFERAAYIRDEIKKIEGEALEE